MKIRNQMKKTNNQKGFTLVELMVVVVIIGILTAIAVPVYTNVTNDANKNAVEANLRTIDSAIMIQQAQNPDTAPSVANLTGTYVQSWPTGPDGVDEYAVTATTPYSAAVTFDAGTTAFGVTVTSGTAYTLAEVKALTNW